MYLLAQLRGSLGTIQYTMLLSEHFSDRRLERVVGVIGIGATSFRREVTKRVNRRSERDDDDEAERENDEEDDARDEDEDD